MSAAVLLSELRRRDIRLHAEGGQLRCSAPAGALTDELRALLRAHKSELLALLASAQACADQARAVVPLQPKGSRTPIFGVPGHNGDVFCYRRLAHFLGEEQPFFGLQPPGLDGAAEPLADAQDLAAHLASEIRRFCPEGPYILAGFCAGGTIAFELAHQLLRGGAELSFVALFGSPYPAYFTRQAQLRHGLVRQLARMERHARALWTRSWRERCRYLGERMRERAARTVQVKAPAPDGVLQLRSKVEAATLRAVRAYAPRRLAVPLKLFLPGDEWLGSGVAALRWREVADHAQVYYGPRTSSGSDMLREPHAAVFAELFRGSCVSDPR